MIFVIKWKWSGEMIIGKATRDSAGVSVRISKDGKAFIERTIGPKAWLEVCKIAERLINDWNPKFSFVEDTDSGIILERA